MKLRRVPGGNVDLEGPRRFLALRHVRFAGGWLEPGELVPVDGGGNYGLRVGHGDIAEVIVPTSGRPGKGTRQ